MQHFQSLAEGESVCLGLQFAFQQYYLPDQPEVSLLAVVVVANNAGQLQLSATVGEPSENILAELHTLDANPQAIEGWCALVGWPWFIASSPIVLTPIAIPKPWGQEIWYTGIEERGQSLVAAQGRSVPLPWLMAVAPQYWVQGQQHQINLLKILDPLPEPIYGDLYFELHEEKQEVYVVTNIDEAAWPSAEGGIRFGFKEAKRSEYDSADSFKQAYLNKVNAYRAVRKDIDDLIDDLRKRDGVALNAPVSASQQKLWLQDIPQALLEKEKQTRTAMDAFVAVKPLSLGDVVKVPCYTPHSLMHGVRTVEFQTPVYERKILSFAQKVLTQTHWDTQAAVDIMDVEAPVAAPLRELHTDTHTCLEEIVDFDDFTVLRLTLAPQSQYRFEKACAYSLLMSLSAGVLINDVTLTAEQAVMMPNGLVSRIVNPSDKEPAIVLISIPKVSDQSASLGAESEA
ncbi:hypothetical protein [Maricurvus nonylphenolicus]|uniref:hypothetical protein n=1 Tax=Maricurvus nonylphenolicus TaxID=1008307 RepID=UPI0036F31B1F